MKYRFLQITNLFLCLFISFFAWAQDETGFIPYKEDRTEKWGFANSKRQVVISLEYDETRPFYEGRARIKIGKKYIW